MVSKSIRDPKSTVTAVPPERTETGGEPDCGVNVRPVIVTVKESAPQKGVSPPKIASVPGVVTMCDVLPGSPGPLQSVSRRRPAAATSAIASMYFFTGRYLPAGSCRVE